MSVIRALTCHLSVAVLAVTTLWAQTPAADSSGTANLMLFFRGVQVGTENVTVSPAGSGWLISATGQLTSPIEIITTKFEMQYAGDWQPRQLVIEGLANGALRTLSTSFGLTTATNDVLRNGQKASSTHIVTPRAIVLPDDSFAAFEGLALRLGSTAAPPGTRIPVYAAPDAEISATVERVTPRRVSLPGRTIEIREFALALATPSGPLPLELWVDSRNRVVRVVLRTASLMAIREDVASVMAREERARNPGDADVFIGASGFSLGATTTTPAGAATSAARRPAVILVSSPGPQDRDYTVFGVSIFAQLAGALADAGHVVVRYDPRGTGRSGGRTENAGLAEYAGDVQQVVAWLRRQRNIDPDRIAIVGYDDGGPLALTAAIRERRIRAVALVAAPGRAGGEVVVERQERLLASLKLSDAERRAKLDLQRRVHNAVLTGTGWEIVPPQMRRQLDTPWFRSWLQFDPAVAMSRLRQPLLVLQGDRDVETPAAYADRLAELSAARRNVRPIHTRKVVVPGVNHLLVPAATGDVDEYDSLGDQALAPAVGAALRQWLADVWTSNEID